MSATKIFENGTQEVLFAGVTFSNEEGWYHVPSDNAMIDSGYMHTVRYWDHATHSVKTETFYLGRPTGYHMEFANDAPAALIAFAALWTMAQQVASDVQTAQRDYRKALDSAKIVRKGSVVRFFKGRKVKVGTVGRVYFEGNGDYGAFVNVESLDKSEAWRYVNPGNLEVIEIPHVDAPIHSAECVRLAGEFSKDTSIAPAFADSLEESGDMEGAMVVRRYAEQMGMC